jgi:Ca2+-dependent lipid-binding protein
MKNVKNSRRPSNLMSLTKTFIYRLYRHDILKNKKIQNSFIYILLGFSSFLLSFQTLYIYIYILVIGTFIYRFSKFLKLNFLFFKVS